MFCYILIFINNSIFILYIYFIIIDDFILIIKNKRKLENNSPAASLKRVSILSMFELASRCFPAKRTASERFIWRRRKTVGGGTVFSGLLDCNPNSGGAIACVHHERWDFTEAASTDRRRDASAVLFLRIPPRVAGSRVVHGVWTRFPFAPQVNGDGGAIYEGVPTHVLSYESGNIDVVWIFESGETKFATWLRVNVKRMFNLISYQFFIQRLLY